MDNRHGLVVATDVRAPSYEAERDAALALVARLEPRARRRTVSADKGYDTDAFVAALRRCHVTPHISPIVHARRLRSAVDRRTTRASRLCRQSVEAQTGGGDLRRGGRRWAGCSPSPMPSTIWCACAP